ncbi:MAG: FimV/HubP family polar landmark protein [Pseudomonadota bacterium]
MTGCGVLRAVILAGAALLTIFFSFPAGAQTAPGSHEVRKGEGLYAIGGKFRYEGVTRFQVVIAIYRANQDVFPEANINVLREGQILRIPSRDEVAAIAPAEAARLWQSLTARPAPPATAVAAVKPAPAVKMPAKPSAAIPPALEEAAKRYREGLALEQRGDHQGALTAFLEAGEAGNGMAQRRLGQIYDKGNTVVQRDYQSALKWYQKAREQGVEMDKPLQRTTPK